MRLYFLRHGLARNREDWKADDGERPLTDEGRERMEQIAATIAGLALQFDVILTSPLKRAVQTASIVAAALHAKDRLSIDDRLGPNFGRGPLAAILRDHADIESLMLVGHEPEMSETISALIGGGRIVCKKGGLACVRLTEAPSLQGELLWLIPPRFLAQ